MFKCPVCGNQFKTYKGMRVHFWKKHPKEWRETRIIETVESWEGIPYYLVEKVREVAHDYASMGETLKENIDDLVRDYPELRKYREPVRLEDLETMEELFNEGQIEAAKEEIKHIFEQFSGEEKKRIYNLLKDYFDALGLTEDGGIKKELEEIRGKIEELEERELEREKYKRELEKKLDELIRLKMKMEEEEKKKEEKKEKGVEELAESIKAQLERDNPEFTVDVKIKDNKVTIIGDLKPGYMDVFNPNFVKMLPFKIEGSIRQIEALKREFTKTVGSPFARLLIVPAEEKGAELYECWVCGYIASKERAKELNYTCPKCGSPLHLVE